VSHKTEQEGQALRVAFETILDASAEPQLPSVADAAVAGGRHIRRRRATFSVAGALAVALTITGAIALPDSGPDHHPAPHPPTNSPQETPTSSPNSTEAPTPPPRILTPTTP
jgi:hypothetical protein